MSCVVHVFIIVDTWIYVRAEWHTLEIWRVPTCRSPQRPSGGSERMGYRVRTTGTAPKTQRSTTTDVPRLSARSVVQEDCMHRLYAPRAMRVLS